MYVWITARLIKEGKLDEFLATWRQPAITPPPTESATEGPGLFTLQPTDNPNEVWGVGFFDSRETIENFRRGPAMDLRREILAPFVVRELWDRVFEAQQWRQGPEPLVYAVYLRPAPYHRYQLMLMSRSARDAVQQADVMVEQMRANGCSQPEWTMRAYESEDVVPSYLPYHAGHAHPHRAEE